MASHKSDPSFWRPSRVLGLLLCGAVLAVPIFVYWHRGVVATGVKEDILDKQQLVVLAAAWAAVIGWLVTSWTSIRNSVKQHTIGTLLQSRLSTTYMERAQAVNNFFGAYEKAHPVASRNPDIDPTQGLADAEPLRYVLNYFEYIAIGIRYGDLHEAMLRSSLRSILTKTTYYSRFWIEERVAGTDTLIANPALYRNVRWLYLRWRDVDVDSSGQPTNDLKPYSMILT